MGAKSKLLRARQLLEELRSEGLELEGGYGAIVAGDLRDCTVIVWASPEGEPFLEMISDGDLTEWYERAVTYKAEHPEESWATAMRETEGAS